MLNVSTSDVAHLEAGAGGEEPAGEPRLELILDRLLGRAVAVDGNAQLVAQRRQALHMVGVLVGDENAGQVLRRAANGGEALANLAQAEARVNEDAGLVGFHVGAVAGGTAAEDGQANRHSLRYGAGKSRGNALVGHGGATSWAGGVVLQPGDVGVVRQR